MSFGRKKVALFAHVSVNVARNPINRKIKEQRRCEGASVTLKKLKINKKLSIFACKSANGMMKRFRRIENHLLF